MDAEKIAASLELVAAPFIRAQEAQLCEARHIMGHVEEALFNEDAQSLRHARIDLKEWIAKFDGEVR